MEFHKVRPVYMDYFCILLGTSLMAIAINCIYDPIGLVTGGFTGIAIIVKQLTGGLVEGGIPLWLTNLALNVPVFLLGWKVKGLRFLGRTAFATIALSFWLYVLPVFSMGVEDFVLSSLFGGVIAGIGIGFVFMARATTGGTDMVAALIQHKLKHYSIVQIMQVIDGIVVLIGACVFGIPRALYAIIAIFVTSWLSDWLIEGVKFSKIAFIITDKKDGVTREVLERMNRGLTGWDATGMYSGTGKAVLFCVVGKKEIVDLKEIVANVDQQAFIVVSDAREVLGEGFLEIKA